MKLFTVILSGVVLVFMISGCVTGKDYMKTSVRQDSIQLICEERNIPWQWDSISQVFTFTSQGVPAKVLVGSKLVLIGTKHVTLDAAVQRKANSIVVPPDFIAKVFEKTEETPIALGPISSLTGKCRMIIVDAGHGGKDPGASGLAGTVEKEIVLDIARKVRTQLEQMGFQVKMTRDSDEFISLAKRTEMASESKADLFVSIHANSSKNRKTRGLEIYYSRTLGHEQDLAQRKANERLMFEHLDISGDKAVPQQIISDLMYDRKLQESVLVADQVIRKTAHTVSASNRGSRSCGFFVVKNTLIPAVLFEVGYISNAAEAKLLQTEDYRQKIADAIAESIKEYSYES